MKLEVGMYLRYKRVSMGWNVEPADKIGKIINNLNCSHIYTLDNNNNIFENDVVKASFDIIDILEVGDYVNGVEVINIDDEWITMSDTQTPILKSIANGMIETVVTKEQFEQMSYKVGGNNDKTY